MKSMNPATGQEIREYPEMTAEEIGATLGKVHETFLEWRTTTFAKRHQLMQKAAELLLDRKEELADLATQEMGKVRKEGIERWRTHNLSIEGVKSFFVFDSSSRNSHATPSSSPANPSNNKTRTEDDAHKNFKFVVEN